MRRLYHVEPDLEMADGTLAISLDALIGALAEAATVLHRIGGTLQVIQERRPTALPGEMVTTAAILEWKDRTDAKEQPEQSGNGAVHAMVQDLGDVVALEPIQETDEAPEVDESSVPEHLRA